MFWATVPGHFKFNIEWNNENIGTEDTDLAFLLNIHQAAVGVMFTPRVCNLNTFLKIYVFCHIIYCLKFSVRSYEKGQP